jgi:hypothetical protein
MYIRSYGGMDKCVCMCVQAINRQTDRQTFCIQFWQKDRYKLFANSELTVELGCKWKEATNARWKHQNSGLHKMCGVRLMKCGAYWRRIRSCEHWNSITYIYCSWVVWVVYRSAEQGFSAHVIHHLKHVIGSLLCRPTDALYLLIYIHRTEGGLLSVFPSEEHH